MNYVIYSKDDCGWCTKVRNLLDLYEFPYKELKLDVDYVREDLRQVVGPEASLVVPQVIRDGKLIGGYSDFVQYLEDSGVMGIQS